MPSSLIITRVRGSYRRQEVKGHGLYESGPIEVSEETAMKRMSRFQLDNKDRVGYFRMFTDHSGVLATPLDDRERATLTAWLGDYHGFKALDFSEDASPDTLWSMAEMFRISVAILFCFRIEEAAYQLLGATRRKTAEYRDSILIEAVDRVLTDPTYAPFIGTCSDVFAVQPENLAEFIGSGHHEDNGMYFVGYQGEIENSSYSLERSEDGLYRLGNNPKPFSVKRKSPPKAKPER